LKCNSVFKCSFDNNSGDLVVIKAMPLNQLSNLIRNSYFRFERKKKKNSLDWSSVNPNITQKNQKSRNVLNNFGEVHFVNAFCGNLFKRILIAGINDPRLFEFYRIKNEDKPYLIVWN
jgi:hypothetical protein